MTNITLNRVVLVKESTHRYDVPKKIDSPKDAVKVFKTVLHIDQAAQEIFAMLCLNEKGDMVGIDAISRGTINACLVSPCDVFRTALLHNAKRIIVAHNHPSGHTDPSREDLLLTAQLVEGGKFIDIAVLDHIIITSGKKYLSFQKSGLLIRKGE